NDRELEVYSFQNVEQIYKQFLNARWLWENKKTGFRLYALSQLYLILGLIHEQRCQTSLPQHFLRALSFLNANFTNRALTVDMICRQAGMSATVFRQLFQRSYRKTPVQYITELRLERARNFISNGMSVEQAALESGFNDSKYFARVVKKHFHCTPRDLKQYGR
ncbi:MAG: helix-turn-helix transcriptional regulator, partial [Clostridia bacterium]|nr:helix-turn-helix transcriptional regulator [Clostridia bacterium]